MTKPRSFRACCCTLFNATLATFAAIALGGCATAPVQTGKFHHSTATQMSAVATTGIAPPEIKLCQLSAGGVREQRDDWTKSARDNARTTLESMRSERVVYLQDVDLSPEISAELAEVQALFRTIDANMNVFGNPMIGLPTAMGRFDFSVGSVDRICEAAGSDALLLIYGEDDYFTGGRKFMVGLGVVASIAATAVTGSGVMMTPSHGAEHVSAALIARDGTLLWYDYLGTGRIGDLREPDGVRTTIEKLLRSMPQPETSTAH